MGENSISRYSLLSHSEMTVTLIRTNSFEKQPKWCFIMCLSRYWSVEAKIFFFQNYMLIFWVTSLLCCVRNYPNKEIRSQIYLRRTFIETLPNTHIHSCFFVVRKLRPAAFRQNGFLMFQLIFGCTGTVLNYPKK